jgi:membrane-bound ClpP family serine protease
LLVTDISPSMVEEVYCDLRTKYRNTNGEIDVLVDSSGGDIDAAYNLACLFQKYGNKKLTFIIPRWAKSAATLVVCAGDEILMTDMAELGPLDPQITQINPMEERFERFSPLHIQTTLEMIRNEFKDGSKDLAEGLLKRLQFPLTLGSFVKAHEIAEQYLVRLLKERMEKTEKLGDKAEEIAKRLTKQYANHGFCINITEAKRIGLNVQELEEDMLELVCDLRGLLTKINDLERKKRETEIMKTIEKLPPEILDKIKSKIKEHEGEEVQ